MSRMSGEVIHQQYLGTPYKLALDKLGIQDD